MKCLYLLNSPTAVLTLNLVNFYNKVFLEKFMEPFSFALLKKITYYDKLRRHFKISNCLPLEM